MSIVQEINSDTEDDTTIGTDTDIDDDIDIYDDIDICDDTDIDDDINRSFNESNNNYLGRSDAKKKNVISKAINHMRNMWLMTDLK